MRNEKLITAREEREWTQEKAAEKIGVSCKSPNSVGHLPRCSKIELMTFLVNAAIVKYTCDCEIEWLPA
jgi:transcriptional regulator with XRE-family HTH domain